MREKHSWGRVCPAINFNATRVSSDENEYLCSRAAVIREEYGKGV